MQEALKKHIHVLAGEIGERNVYRPGTLSRAADYIHDCWQHQGYEVVQQSYPVRDMMCANLEVTQIGERHPDHILLLGAHYDTVLGSPGANDNGTGVAALLELSRLFKDVSPGCTVRFVAFVNEESPFFYTMQQGSRVYARAARSRGDHIRLMISLETIGYYRTEHGSQRYPPLFRLIYPDTANFVALVANLRTRKLMHQLARAFRNTCDFPLQHVATLAAVPGISWSDHASFWKEGYPALMITDTAFYRYPWYHSPEDTPDKVNYTALARVTEGLSKAVEELDRAFCP
jgi:Zn-dependent M28 family amino/carboxypeptidase